MKVYAYASTTQVRLLALADTLDGGDRLPCFRPAFRELFEQPPEPP